MQGRGGNILFLIVDGKGVSFLQHFEMDFIGGNDTFCNFIQLEGTGWSAKDCGLGELTPDIISFLA